MAIRVYTVERQPRSPFRTLRGRAHYDMWGESAYAVAMQNANGDTLLEFASTLYSMHLGESVDAFIRARRFSKDAPGLKPREHRFAAAAVVHAYAGLEAVANMFKFELYGYKDGRFHRPIDSSDLPLQRFVREWDRVAVEQRCRFLMSTQGAVFEPSLEARVLEVRQLRHLLAHGHSMPGVILIERVGDENRVEVDVPYDGSKFPVLRFPRPDELTCDDARRAVEVVLLAAHAVAHAFGHVLGFVSYEISASGAPQHFGGGSATGSVERILTRADAV